MQEKSIKWISNRGKNSGNNDKLSLEKNLHVKDNIKIILIINGRDWEREKEGERLRGEKGIGEKEEILFRKKRNK